jgi:hypothetical protein
MSARARNATSLRAIAAIAAIAALLVAGASDGGASAACGAATAATYRASALAVAERIAAGESGGTTVLRELRRVERDQVLAAAVAAGDRAAARREMLVLLFNHQHIVRIRVVRDGHLFEDVGGALVLAPVSGRLRFHGRVVGTVTMSLQDDMGYRLLLERLIGARVVISYRGHAVMSDIALRDGARLPASGSIRTARGSYLVASLSIGRFPRGRLRIALLVAAPPAALARSSCAAVRARLLVDVARLGYAQARSGPSVRFASERLASATALPAALAAGDVGAVARIVRGLVAGGGFGGLRVLDANGRLVAGARAHVPLLAPVSRRIGYHGRRVGRAVFSVQNARGYSDLAHFLTGAPILVRAGSERLAGSFPGPARLPVQGPLRYRGVRYEVASFAGRRFPSGTLRVYVLAPG